MTDPSAPTSRRSHPLLGGFPLAVMALSTFLVVFALMMARLSSGGGAGLSASSGTAVVRGVTARGAVTTRTSGAGATAAAAQAAPANPSAAAAVPVSTRTSGALGAGGAGDE
jgi:hypothetical protein